MFLICFIFYEVRNPMLKKFKFAQNITEFIDFGETKTHHQTRKT